MAKWTKPEAYVDGTYPHQVYTATPIGYLVVSWESWKDVPRYTVYFNDCGVETFVTLEEAKVGAVKWLETKLKETSVYLTALKFGSGLSGEIK